MRASITSPIHHAWKMVANFRRNSGKVRARYEDFRANPLTRGRPGMALLKYIWINLRMHVLGQEIDMVFLNDVKCRMRKGDGISGNYFFRLYEYQDSLFVLHFLRPGDCFVDVGANVGHYSLIAAKKCGARVIAVEPIPDSFGRLENNIELNCLAGLVDARRLGLSNADGVLHFTTNYSTANRVTAEPTPNSTRVKVTSLDELCAAESVKLLKIDVEGYEKFVLQGARKQLASDSLDAIIIELNGSGRVFHVEDDEVIGILEEHGFAPYRYDPSTRELAPLAHENDDGYNTIFVKNIKNVRARIRQAPPVRVAHGFVF